MTYTFTSEVQLGAQLMSFTEQTIKDEPMFFNCDSNFARENGGPITRNFIQSLTPKILGKRVVFDSRVHMLMPGWYPCIPGWHHDDVPRERYDGQPEYDNPSYRSKHAAAIVGAPGVSHTLFALGTRPFPKPQAGEVAYGVWDTMVEHDIIIGELEAWEAPMNQIVYFDDRTWHTGQPAKKSGWRWFGRASWDTGREPTNEIRRQVQVYLENPRGGW